MSDDSKSWYRMTRPLFNSGFEDDEFFAYGRDGFQEMLDSFVGTDVLIYDKSIDSDPQQVRAIVQQKISDVYNSTMVRQILCNIGTLKCGQYVKCDGAMWLVSSLPDNNRIYEKAVLWKCKHTIRFISPLTKKVVSYPVHSVNSTQYGTGEAGKEQMTVGNDQHLIYIPFNEETILVDSQFRLLIDKNRIAPSAYRVTKVDSVSYAVGDEHRDDGLIQWAVLEDQFNAATDNAELMVADYYKVSDQSDTEQSDKTGSRIVLTDLDGDFKVACGEDKKIRIQIYGKDGLQTSEASYRLEYDFDGAASIVDQADGIITLRASDDMSYIGRKVKIKVVSEEVEAESEISIQIVNW